MLWQILGFYYTWRFFSMFPWWADLLPFVTIVSIGLLRYYITTKKDGPA